MALEHGSSQFLALEHRIGQLLALEQGSGQLLALDARPSQAELSQNPTMCACTRPRTRGGVPLLINSL